MRHFCNVEFFLHPILHGNVMGGCFRFIHGNTAWFIQNYNICILKDDSWLCSRHLSLSPYRALFNEEYCTDKQQQHKDNRFFIKQKTFLIYCRTYFFENRDNRKQTKRTY